MSEHIERDEDIILKNAVRFEKSSELRFMESHVYRSGRGSTYPHAVKDIHLMSALNPSDELRAVAHRMLKLARVGVRFRDMAVITGDLSIYGHVIEQEFEQAGIPYFIDSRKSVLDNCLVEFVRALLEVISEDFNYESVFRYLKTGMTDISPEDIDCLENYILATGTRGFRRWQNFLSGAIREWPTVSLRRSMRCAAG